MCTEDRAGPFQISGKKKWNNLKITRNGQSCLLQPYIESATTLSDNRKTICDRTWEKGPIGVVDHFFIFFTLLEPALHYLTMDTRANARSASVAELQTLKHEEL